MAQVPRALRFGRERELAHKCWSFEKLTAIISGRLYLAYPIPPRMRAQPSCWLPLPERSRYDQTIPLEMHLRARRRLAGTSMPAPEVTARQHIDRALTESGWAVLDIANTNLGASRGVSIREFPLASRHGF